MTGWIRRVRDSFRTGMAKELLGEFRWMLGYSVHYRVGIAWYIFLGVFGTAMSLGVGVMSKYIIDAVTGGSTSQLLLFAAGYVVMSLVQIAAGACSVRVSARIQIEVTQEIRAGVFARILTADWESLSEYHSGDLLTRINGDVNTVAMSVLNWIPNFITGFVRFAGTLGLILYYDPMMAVLALAGAPVMLALSQTVTKKIRGHNQKILKINSELTSFNEETLQNLQSIKAFSLAGHYQDALEEKQDAYRDAQLDYNRFTTFTNAVMSVAGLLVTGVCFGWGAYRLWTGAITYGTMTLFLQQAGGLSSAFYTLVSTAPNAIRAATSAGRVMKLVQLPQEESGPTDDVAEFRRYAASHGGVTVCAERLSFGYRDGRGVLADVSFCVRPRETVALVGPSGEGKTTLLKLMLGLVRAQKGHVCASSGGRTVEVSPATRQLFAYVPQGNTMMSGTIRDNLRLLCPDASDDALWAVLRDVCAEEFVKNMPDGLDTYLKERGGGLSEGQLQRLSIARALLSDAPVLLLDEATSALDVATERQLLRNVMQSAQSRTCIVTTHRPSVLSMCSRVYRVGEHGVTQADEADIRSIIENF